MRVEKEGKKEEEKKIFEKKRLLFGTFHESNVANAFDS